MTEMDDTNENLRHTPAAGNSNCLTKQHHHQNQHAAKHFNSSQTAHKPYVRNIVRQTSRRKMRQNSKESIRPKTQTEREVPMDHTGLHEHLQADRNSQHFDDSLHGIVLPLTCLLSQKMLQPSLVMYNCDMCEFKTARLGNIVTHHKLLHMPVQSSGVSHTPADAKMSDQDVHRTSDEAKKQETKLGTELAADELPDIISSEPNASLTEGDIVWSKVYRCPYWPAVVKSVYKVKNKIKKVTVLFLEMGSQRKPYTLSGANIKKKISPFGNEYESHDKLMKEFCRSPYGEIAKQILDKIDEYLLLKQQMKVSCSALKYFNLLSQDEDRKMENELSESHLEDLSVENVEHNNTLAIIDGEIVDPFLKSCLKKRYDRCQQLLDYCRTPDIKDYMKKILSGEVYSFRHQLYNKPALEPDEKCILRNISFGPIEDEHQQNQLVHILKAQYKSISSLDSYQSIKYFTDVVFPEVIIYAIQATFRKPRHKAEKLYHEGFILSRREYKEQQRELKASLTRVEPNREKHQLGKIRCRLHLKL